MINNKGNIKCNSIDILNRNNTISLYRKNALSYNIADSKYELINVDYYKTNINNLKKNIINNINDSVINIIETIEEFEIISENPEIGDKYILKINIQDINGKINDIIYYENNQWNIIKPYDNQIVNIIQKNNIEDKYNTYYRFIKKDNEDNFKWVLYEHIFYKEENETNDIKNIKEVMNNQITFNKYYENKTDYDIAQIRDLNNVFIEENKKYFLDIKYNTGGLPDETIETLPEPYISFYNIYGEPITFSLPSDIENIKMGIIYKQSTTEISIQSFNILEEGLLQSYKETIIYIPYNAVFFKIFKPYGFTIYNDNNDISYSYSNFPIRLKTGASSYLTLYKYLEEEFYNGNQINKPILINNTSMLINININSKGELTGQIISSNLPSYNLEQSYKWTNLFGTVNNNFEYSQLHLSFLYTNDTINM